VKNPAKPDIDQPHYRPPGSMPSTHPEALDFSQLLDLALFAFHCSTPAIKKNYAVFS
jgi:hypothetical protein